MHDQLLSPSPAPHPSLDDELVGWKFQASNHGLLILVTSPDPEAVQEPTRGHLFKTKDSKEYGSVVSETGVKD